MESMSASPERSFALGCDVGATKVSVSITSVPGRIQDRIRDTTRRMMKPHDLANEVSALIARLLERNNVQIRECIGLGVAFAGFVRSSDGTVVFSPNIEGWNDTPLQSMLEDALSIPVRVHNDANAGALGEYRHGGLCTGEDFLYVSVSTGIGSGLIIGGAPYEGSNSIAGEIGHMTVIEDGPRCGCGKYGCLEAVSSGLAVERIAGERLRRERTTLLGRVEREGQISAKTVFEEARKGDILSMEIVDDACRYLGLALSSAVMLMSFSSVVIGGGMAKEGEFLRSRVEHYMLKNIPRGPNEKVKLLISKYPEDIVDIGALELAFGGKH